VARRWWLIALLAAVGAALALLASGGGSQVASARLHVVPTVLAYDQGGDVAPQSDVKRQLSDWTASEFKVRAAAEVAAEQLGDITPEQLLAAVSMTPISLTDVDLEVSAGSQERARELLDAYVDAYVDYRRDADIETLERANDQLQIAAGELNEDQTGRRFQMVLQMDRLESAIDLVPQQIRTQGGIEVGAAEAELPTAGAAVGGLLAGAALGILLALLLGRFERRIRSGADVADAADRPVLLFDPAQGAAAFSELRAELELAGAGRTLSTVAVSAPTAADGDPAVARGLAEAFAASGRPTVLVTGDADAAPGQVAGDLTVLTATRTGGGYSGGSVERLLSEAREHGDVVVVDAPPVDGPADGLLLVATADAVLLLLTERRSRWKGFARALARLETVGVGRLVLCAKRPLRGSARRRAAAQESAAAQMRTADPSAKEPVGR
jgi:hypothetical protein